MRAHLLALALSLLVACSASPTPRSSETDASMPQDASTDTSRTSDAGASVDATPSDDTGPADDDAWTPTPCTTRITYGATWIHGPGHDADFDDADGLVTWDGTCTHDGANTYATLSNGWQPYFAGASCLIALDHHGDCGVPTTCATRVSYGASWLAAPMHDARFDDVTGVVTWSGVCHDEGGGRSSAQLSNGWTPFFSGTGACDLSFRYEECGGLFANPVVATDCPDPGVVFDGTQYVMACTGGDYALRTSPDLVHWTPAGTIFAAGRRPSWAVGDFWAPEIHRVGDHWVAYFSARNGGDGSLAIGAATGPTALGPFTDIGHPLVDDPHPGVIDAHHFEAPDGTQYLLYKVDGNAVGAPTPIYAQPLEADGLTFRGGRTEILRNDRAWEGGLVEGPWMIFESGTYYLFYSANGYASTRYAIGVARASSPLGPFEKAGAPILTSEGAWAGPGHGSVVRAPGGEWAHVYHAWEAAHVGGAPGRLDLVDRITWEAGWPRMLSAPTTRSQPLP